MNPLAAAQGLWRHALPSPLRRWAAPVLMGAASAYVHAAGRPRPAPGAALPIKVVGMFSAPHGIGASARLCLRAFQALGVHVEAVDAGNGGLDLGRRLNAPQPGAWIFHLNPPEMIAALASLGPRRVVGPRYGFWAWELPQAPASWLKAARLVDEVWAPSRYTADAFAGADVRVTPHPLFLEDYDGVQPAPRRAAFEAVTLFDFNSSVARKNPFGAITAFHRAFGDDAGCRLTLKAQNGARYPELLAALRTQCGPNIEILDEVWPYARVLELIAGADALISLHRAEGFGLTLAEAMALGTPVIATAFSGPLDFMDEDAALSVPFQLTEVDDPQAIYRSQVWADPDIAVAAEYLSRLRNEQGLGARLATQARRVVSERLSPEAWFATLPQAVQAAAAP